jgi:hypothetical protein
MVENKDCNDSMIGEYRSRGDTITVVFATFRFPRTKTDADSLAISVNY